MILLLTYSPEKDVEMVIILVFIPTRMGLVPPTANLISLQNINLVLSFPLALSLP